MDPTIIAPPFKWEHLNTTFMIKCHNFINMCAMTEIMVVPLEGFVSLHEQAHLWMGGKTQKQVDDKVVQLRINGGNFIADILQGIEVTRGFWRTDDVPGFNWHNWGKALTFKISPEGNRDHSITQKHLRGLELTYQLLENGHYAIQADPDTVEKTYDIGFVNNYFKEKMEDKSCQDQ